MKPRLCRYPKALVESIIESKEPARLIDDLARFIPNPIVNPDAQITSGERKISIIVSCCMHVACEGIDGFFFNCASHPQTILEFHQALIAVGALERANLMEQAMAIFPNKQPPVVAKAFMDCLSFESAETKQLLADLFAEFLGMSEDVYEIMARYIESNQGEFAQKYAGYSVPVKRRWSGRWFATIKSLTTGDPLQRKIGQTLVHKLKAVKVSPKEIVASTNIEEDLLENNELRSYALLNDLEKCFKIDISNDDLARIETVSDLVEYLELREAERRESEG